MTEFSRISTSDAKALRSKQPVTTLDIRDRDSFERAHLPNAIHIDDINVADFVAAADDLEKAAPLLIYCYHGNSSQSAAAYFSQQGFSNALSMDGGFEVWRAEGLAEET